MKDRAFYEARRRLAANGFIAGGLASLAKWGDGNMPVEEAAEFLVAAAGGDDGVYIRIPDSPLSGEWADGPSPNDVLRLAGVNLDPDEPENDGLVDELLRAFEMGFSQGALDETLEWAADSLGVELVSGCYPNWLRPAVVGGASKPGSPEARIAVAAEAFAASEFPPGTPWEVFDLEGAEGDAGEVIGSSFGVDEREALIRFAKDVGIVGPPEDEDRTLCPVHGAGECPGPPECEAAYTFEGPFPLKWRGDLGLFVLETDIAVLVARPRGMGLPAAAKPPAAPVGQTVDVLVRGLARPDSRGPAEPHERLVVRSGVGNEFLVSKVGRNEDGDTVIVDLAPDLSGEGFPLEDLPSEKLREYASGALDPKLRAAATEVLAGRTAGWIAESERRGPGWWEVLDVRFVNVDAVRAASNDELREMYETGGPSELMEAVLAELTGRGEKLVPAEWDVPADADRPPGTSGSWGER